MKSAYIAAIALLCAASVNAQTTVERTLDLGDFENPTQQISNGQNLEQAPFNFYYAVSGSQVIYSAAEIAPIVEHAGKITSISFVYGDESWSSYYEFSNHLECYIQLIDETQFNYVDSRSNWFKPANVSSTATLDYSYTLDKLGEKDIITLTFPTPFEVSKEDAGKSLLVTCTQSYTDGDSDSGQYWQPYVYSNDAHDYRMGCYGKDNGTDTFFDLVAAGAEIHNVGGTASDCYKYDLPVARIAYTYVDEAAGIESAVVAGSGESRIFDLQGREVSGKPAAGIYIVCRDGKTSKVVLR